MAYRHLMEGQQSTSSDSMQVGSETIIPYKERRRMLKNSDVGQFWGM